MGCTGKGKDTSNGREPEDSDTLYTWRAAMQVYGYQPERALQIIDSAVIVGNMSEVQAEANRARVYSMTQVNEQMDSLLGGSKDAGLKKGKAICERLLKHDSLKTNIKLKQEVLDILVYTERQLQDTIMWLQRSRELVEVYHQMGPEKETDALRTEAELGAALYFAGQQQEGLAKLDSVINLLNDSIHHDDNIPASAFGHHRRAYGGSGNIVVALSAQPERVARQEQCHHPRDSREHSTP